MMKTQINDYLSKITDILKNNPSGIDWNGVMNEHLIKIQFYQHERLIHLIVTALFALMEIICFALIVISPSVISAALSIAILILLVPYVFHYYFLENSVQKLYVLYDEILKKISGNSQ